MASFRVIGKREQLFYVDVEASSAEEAELLVSMGECSDWEEFDENTFTEDDEITVCENETTRNN